MKLVAAAIALVACGPTSYPGPPDVTLGWGVTEFNVITDGEQVPIIHGLQGGYHVWGAVRARYVEPVELSLQFTLTPMGSSFPATIRNDVVDLEGAGDGSQYGTHLGTQVFLPDPKDFADIPCVFHLDVKDHDGRTGSDEHTIVPVGP